MASTPYDANMPANTPYADRTARAVREDEAPRARSVGEHVFIWIAWALAAAFWGATLTTMTGILRAAGAASPAMSAPGAPGVSAYLVLVATAFIALAAALAYASLRSASGSRRVGEAATAALYEPVEGQQAEDGTIESADAARADREFR